MAHYERDYGREYGRRGRMGPPQMGGMRSDGWGGSGDWRDFAGEEGWYGQGYEGVNDPGFDRSFRGGEWEWRGGRGGQGGRGDFPGGYGSGFRGRGGGGRGWDSGYGGREEGYNEEWGEPGGWRGRDRERAADIMTEDPEVVTPDASLEEVARKMRDLDVGIIPVVESADSRRLRGVITDRDIAVRAVAEGKAGNAKVSDCMTESVRSVNKNDSIQDVMRIMRQEQVRRVPVTDREGRLVGIIAQADLAVDYAAANRDRELEVGETLERVSEPGRPNRMAASGRTAGKDQNQEPRKSAENQEQRQRTARRRGNEQD